MGGGGGGGGGGGSSNGSLGSLEPGMEEKRNNINIRVDYKAYGQRWVVLVCVVLLTIANNALWISFATVNSKAAEYFDKTSSEIDLLSTISFVVGIPFCLLSTWIVDRLGLRWIKLDRES